MGQGGGEWVGLEHLVGINRGNGNSNQNREESAIQGSMTVGECQTKQI